MTRNPCPHGNQYKNKCKQCKKIYNQKHKDNVPLYLWSAAKARAKVEHVPFTIEISDIVVPTHCPVLGIPLDYRNRNHAPSLDKIIAKLGYTKPNVCVISGKANRIKSDATYNELQAIVNYVQKYHSRI